MNNITFGNEKGGYYETVGGGKMKMKRLLKCFSFERNIKLKARELVRVGTDAMESTLT